MIRGFPGNLRGTLFIRLLRNPADESFLEKIDL